MADETPAPPRDTTVQQALSIAEDALREIASPGCMVIHSPEDGSWIDTGIPQRIAERALRDIEGVRADV